ncbi:hypothetical protein ACFL4P_02045 [Gemmatimonadota bacterium]
MRFIRNNILLLGIVSLLLSGPVCLELIAEELPGHLTIVPDSGVVILDNDTLQYSETIELEVLPGEHLLRFFPLHTAGLWAHRYIEYPFTLGSQGRRIIDLKRRSLLSFQTEPQSASLFFRGRLLGHTPGEYLFLAGTGDSVLVNKQGYQPKVLDLDQILEYGTDIFLTLERDNSEAYLDQLSYDDNYRSPFKAMLSPDLMFSLGAGIGLLVTGSHFNREADKHYEHYLRLIGSKAREDAFSQAHKNDRISKATFIAGDIALGVFGYLVIRRLIFKSAGPDNPGKKRRELSFQVHSACGEAGISLEF